MNKQGIAENLIQQEVFLQTPLTETEKQQVPIQAAIQKESFDPTHYQLLELRGLPFWIVDKNIHAKRYDETKGKCCFNHVIGLPRTDNGETLPIWDYELEYLRFVHYYRKVAQNKSRGSGISETTLRFIIWLAINQYDLRPKRICIVTGPELNLSADLIDRIRQIIWNKFPFVKLGKHDRKITLCTVKIQAFPSFNIGALRGYTNVLLIYVDEGDNLPKFAQQESRYVIDGYRLKNNPYTIWSGTPDKPDGMLARFKAEGRGRTGYYYYELNYRQVTGKLYDPKMIEEEKLKDYFPKEFDNKFIGNIGNLFHIADIEACKYSGYDPDIGIYGTLKVCGVDPSQGAGLAGLCILELSSNHIRVLHAEDYEFPRAEKFLDDMKELDKKYKIDKFYVDAARPDIASDIKENILFEDSDTKRWSKVIKLYREKGLELDSVMSCITFPFDKYRIKMNDKITKALERRYLQIHPKFEKLLSALGSATGDDKGKLDKELTNYDDIFDAFSLAMMYFNIPT